MKKISLPLCCLLFTILSFGQSSKTKSGKPSIGPDVFGKWPYISGAKISNDGRHAIYSIQEPSEGRSSNFLYSIFTGQKIDLGSSEAQIADDSRYAFFKNSNNSLGIITLQTGGIEYIPDVAFFKIPEKSSAGVFAYLLRSSRKMILKNLDSNKQVLMDSVTNFYFSESGKDVLVISTSHGVESFEWLNTYNENRKTIWESKPMNLPVSRLMFDRADEALAFVVETKTEYGLQKTLWSYHHDSDSAILISADYLTEENQKFVITGIDYRGFIENGRKLFVNLKEADKTDTRKKVYSGVDVWSYTDKALQSQQLKEVELQTYLGIIDIGRRQIVRLQQKNEIVFTTNDSYGLLISSEGSEKEWNWSEASNSSIYLVSLKNGSRTTISNKIKGLTHYIVSCYLLTPDGKYVIYYAPEKGDYYSYEIATGRRINMTASLNTVWTTYIKRDVPYAKYMPIGFAGTLKSDEAILVYDQHDIYQLDPTGKKPVLNITNGYGRKQNIEFRLALDNKRLFNEDETIIVSAFNRINKNDGFYSIKAGQQKDPKLLTAQPYVFKGTWEDDRFKPVAPIKAKNAEVYVVRRMSAEESPNYFWTMDFKTFNRITDIHPEKNYNWLRTELVTWKTTDGNLSQGILYKPENFDSRKKYPLIFYYYENSSEGLHGFLEPDVTRGTLNIPYYVSNGYLVFTPDIHYKIGYPGQSVVNTIVSAAKHLSTLPYVDGKRMGIQGHSRGGWETNYLVTHTDLFAAAMSSAGMSNYISLYNGVRNLAGGDGRRSGFEYYYQRIGATLWEKPNLYIKNSPIFHADKVTTPVLMMHNREDDDVPFEQGLEFFMALRRLGKRAWLLQYDGEGHIVFDKAADDLEIRMKQYFDHYLKGAPAPRWMLEGIPAKDKGIDDGLELVKEKDKNGKWITPGPGLLKTNQ